jgi:hypothetical protein
MEKTYRRTATTASLVAFRFDFPLKNVFSIRQFQFYPENFV